MEKSSGLFSLIFLLSVGCSAQLYTISTIAGGAPLPTPALAVNQPLTPAAIAADATGIVYFASDDCVFRLDRSGVMTRIAGTGRRGYSGDGGAAVNAQLNLPSGLALDGDGSILVADTGNHRIRRISTDGVIVTVAGSGVVDNTGDGGAAVNAALRAPTSVAVDSKGDFFIGDNTYFRAGPDVVSLVRKVSPDGVIHAVNTATPISGAAGLAVDAAGNLFIADIGHSRIVEVMANAEIMTSGASVTVAGGGSAWPGDGGAATAARLIRPFSLAFDAMGNLYIGDQGQIPQGGYLAAVRKVTAAGAIGTVAGGGQVDPINVPPPSVPLQNAAGVAADGAGNLYIADGRRILEVSAAGNISVLAGSSGTLPPAAASDGGPAVNAPLNLTGSAGVAWQSCLARDASGNLYISESALSRIRKVAPDGTITTIAGTGQQGYSGDDGPAMLARISIPSAIAVDAAGNLYFADLGNSRVRKISAGGIITTLLSYGALGYSVSGLAADAAGNVYFSDSRNSAIRKVQADATVSTVTAADTPMALAIDNAGSLYFADGARIRKFSAAGITTTVAGNGVFGYAGDGGPAVSAEIDEADIAVDAAGNLFLGDWGNNRIRRVSAAGVISTVAGNGLPGFVGDAGPALTAELNHPYGIAVDDKGNVYVADEVNKAIRLLQPSNRSLLIGGVVDAASEAVTAVSPGKIVVIYGTGLGPAQLARSQPNQAGAIGVQVAGTTVTFNGISAPVLYSSAMQVCAIVPYELTGTTAQVVVTYIGQISAAFSVPVAPAAPSLFTVNETGAGQAATVNPDGTVNSAGNPAKIGSYISLYATGEGQTAPGGVDGQPGAMPLPRPVLPVSVTIGGRAATVMYAGAAPGEVAGLLQVNVQIPAGVQTGGYVPVSLRVGGSASQPGVWIAVAGN